MAAGRGAVFEVQRGRGRVPLQLEVEVHGGITGWMLALGLMLLGASGAVIIARAAGRL